MKRLLALLWLGVVAVAAAHVATALLRGLPLQSDLMALLPAEDRDPVLAGAKAQMAEHLSRRVVALVGDVDPARARQAAAQLRQGLVEASVLSAESDVPEADALRRLGRFYFAHRSGLLSAADRAALSAGRADDLTARALSQVFGVGGAVNADLLRADPFLLLPSFMTALPLPAGRLALVDGWPCVIAEGTTWVLVGGKLSGNAYSLADQDRFIAAWDRLTAAFPASTQTLRLGAVFYAHAGARQAIGETSLIGICSLLGTLALILLAFRDASPLLLSILAIGVGLACATSASLLAFGRLHVIALTFGASLIGVSVDYSLHYFCQGFAPRGTPRERLAHIRPGLILGLVTSLLGYAAIGAAPLPGLHQVALFSTVGLLASFATVVLWFPFLDRSSSRRLPSALCRAAEKFWGIWDRPRLPFLAVLILAAVWGGLHVSTLDDVRHQQSLDPTLRREQARIQELIGIGIGSQFYLVQAADEETALQREEALGQRLDALIPEGALSGWNAPARFLPSAARRTDSARLVEERLIEDHLPEYARAIGLPPDAGSPPSVADVRLAELDATGALPLLPDLVLDHGLHVVTLDNPADLPLLAEAANGLEGVRFVDPTADIGALLERYRHRAIWVLLASAATIAPLLCWRYGLRGGLFTLAPPGLSILAAPLLLAAFGTAFSFFSAMALILVLSVGVDYAVFCAEAGERRDPVTVVANWLAALTTLLSFGLLAFSRVAAVHAFGLTMLAGLALAILFAPLAGRARPIRGFRP
jgi:predicted exporter